jgi:hypothetical protein
MEIALIARETEQLSKETQTLLAQYAHQTVVAVNTLVKFNGA